MEIKFSLILLLVVPLWCVAQDSTEIMLRQYKDLYNKGLINESEYEQLRKDALKLQAPTQQGTVVVYPKQDTIDLDKLKRTFRAQHITGTLELLAGAGFVAGFGYSRWRLINYPYNTGNASLRVARLYLLTGAIFTGIGIYSIVRGSKNRQKYIRFSTSGITLTF